MSIRKDHPSARKFGNNQRVIVRGSEFAPKPAIIDCLWSYGRGVLRSDDPADGEAWYELAPLYADGTINRCASPFLARESDLTKMPRSQLQGEFARKRA
jgi:hypothetical protein